MKKICCATFLLLILLFPINIRSDEDYSLARRRGGQLGMKMYYDLRGKSDKYKVGYLTEFFKKARLER